MSTWRDLIDYCIEQQHAFVVWKEPQRANQPHVGQLIASPLKDTLRPPARDDSGFIIQPFAREEGLPTLFFPSDLYLREDKPEDWDKINHTALGKHEYPESENTASFQPEYIKEVEAYQQEIGDGQVDKVIASRVKHVEALPKSEWADLYLRLCENYPKAFNYLFFHPAAGVWMGASPEILLSGKNKHYKTVSLAGTLPAQENGEYNWSGKELMEHQWVADFIWHKLKVGFAKNMQREDIETVVSGPVAHLRTCFSFDYAKAPLALAEKLHPTPAISGHPVDAAMRLIATHEKHQRGYYTGFLGKLDGPAATELFVNLRCMRLDTERFEVYVGGGITDLSDPQAEWEETENKAKTMLAVVEQIRTQTTV